jgi:hypothetical protein
VSSIGNSWFETLKYHAEHVHLYRVFPGQKSHHPWQSNILSQEETDEKMQALAV